MLNKKHLKMFKGTKEGDKFIDELLSQLIHEFDVINGKIIKIQFKERPILDLDAIEHEVKKMRKEI